MPKYYKALSPEGKEVRVLDLSTCREEMTAIKRFGAHPVPFPTVVGSYNTDYDDPEADWDFHVRFTKSKNEQGRATSSDFLIKEHKMKFYSVSQEEFEDLFRILD